MASAGATRPNGGRPRVLISNDDGIAAPGLLALADALHRDGEVEFAVSGPSGERSAQSHCISVGKHLHAWEIDIPGAVEAYAVDGTPADSVMIAIFGPLLKNKKIDLVVSGINRGDNCGLHVIYSGTVGAAREAACKDIPSIALSLDNHHARSQEQYGTAAQYSLALIKAALGVLPCGVPRALRALAGTVLNVNLPGGERSGYGSADGADGGTAASYRGFYLAHQGQHCHLPNFRDVEPADAALQPEHAHMLRMGAVTVRAFRNAAGYLRGDETPGCDSWAVRQRWVAVTPVGLRSDVPLASEAALARGNHGLIHAVVAILRAAAAQLGVEVGGPDGVLDCAAAGKPSG